MLIDFDHDGALDLALVNGAVKRSKDAKPDAATVAALGPFWGQYGDRNQLFANDGKGANRRVIADTGGSGDRGQWMDAGRGPRRLIEQLERAGEIEIRVGRDNARDGQVANRLGDQDRAGLGAAHFRRVGRVGEEGEVSRSSVLHSRDAMDLDPAIPNQRAPQRFGNLQEFHKTRLQSTRRRGEGVRLSRGQRVLRFPNRAGHRTTRLRTLITG